MNNKDKWTSSVMIQFCFHFSGYAFIDFEDKRDAEVGFIW